MKEEKYTGQIKILIEPGDENENKITKTNIEYDGEKNGEAREQQR